MEKPTARGRAVLDQMHAGARLALVYSRPIYAELFGGVARARVVNLRTFDKLLDDGWIEFAERRGMLGFHRLSAQAIDHLYGGKETANGDNPPGAL